MSSSSDLSLGSSDRPLPPDGTGVDGLPLADPKTMPRVAIVSARLDSELRAYLSLKRYRALKRIDRMVSHLYY